MPANFKAPSAKVLAARERRIARAKEQSARTEWFVDKVATKIHMTMSRRVKVATEFTKNRVVKNISRPVTKGIGPRGGFVVTNRSKPGEFPKADTTQLMKTIFGVVEKQSDSVWDGFIGTPLDYGLTLEIRMKRSFLLRTFNEERFRITRILTGPV